MERRLMYVCFDVLMERSLLSRLNGQRIMEEVVSLSRSENTPKPSIALSVA